MPAVRRRVAEERVGGLEGAGRRLGAEFPTQDSKGTEAATLLQRKRRGISKPFCSFPPQTLISQLQTSLHPRKVFLKPKRNSARFLCMEGDINLANPHWRIETGKQYYYVETNAESSSQNS